MIFVLVIVLLLLLLANKLFRITGESGAGIISRVMGLILASVAIASILEGIMVYFQL